MSKIKYIYGKETAPNEKVVMLADAEVLERERDEAVRLLKEWTDIFGSTPPHQVDKLIQELRADLRY